jgi:hypothetical protein
MDGLNDILCIPAFLRLPYKTIQSENGIYSPGTKKCRCLETSDLSPKKRLMFLIDSQKVVVHAKAYIQYDCMLPKFPDSRFRENDEVDFM